MNKSKLLPYCILILMLFTVSYVNATTYYGLTGTTPTNVLDWGTVSGGSGTHPANFTTASDVFIIESGTTMTASANWLIGAAGALASTLQINNGGTLSMSTHLLTLASCNFINAGTFTSTTGGVTISGTLVANSIAGFTTIGAVTMTKTTGIATFQGNVGGAALTINGSGGTLDLGSGLTHTFTGAVTLTNGTLNGDASILNENMISAAAWGGVGTNFIAGSSTVNFGAAGNQTLSASATTFNNLTFNGSGIKTLSSITTINNNLSVTGCTLADGGFQIIGNGTGTLTVASGAMLQIGKGTNTNETFPTLFTTANITLGATSTVNYNWITGVTQVIAGSVGSVGPSTYGNLTITGASGTKTLASSITVEGNLSIATAGETFADGGYIITVNGNVTNNATYSGTGEILLSGGSAVHTVTGTTDTYGTLELNDANGATFANTSATTTVGTLKVTSGTLTLNAFTTGLTVTGTTTVASGGILKISSAVGTKTFSGAVSITGTFTETVAAQLAFGSDVTINGTLTEFGAAVVGVAGNFNNNGSYNASTGVHTFSGATMSISGTNPISIPSLAVTGTYTNNDSLIVGTALSGAGTLTQGTNAILNIGGTSLITILTCTTYTPNTVYYTSTAAAQVIKSTTYYNLTVDKLLQTGTLGGAITVNNNLLIKSGTLADGIFLLSGPGSTGTFTISSTGIFTMTNTNTGTTSANAGSFPIFGSYAFAIGSTVNYNGAAAQPLYAIPSPGYGIVSITTAALTSVKTASGAFAVQGLLKIGSATSKFADNGFIITVNGNVTNNGTHASSGSGEILLSGGSAGGHTVTGTTDTYGTLELNDANGATFANTITTTTVGILTVTAGTLLLNSFATSLTVATTNVSGTLTFNNGTGTRSMGAVTVNTGGVVNITVAQAAPLITLSSLNINGGTWNDNAVNEPVTINTGAFTNTGTFNSGTGTYTFSAATSSINGNATTFSSLTINSATGTTNNISAAGGLTVITTLAGAGTLIQAASANLFIGAAIVTPTLTATASGNTVTYNGTVQTVKGTTYYNLTCSASTSGTLGAVATINGNLSVTSGIFADGGFQITGNATGTLTVASGATLQIGKGTATVETFPSAYTSVSLDPASTVIYNSTGAMPIAGGITYGNLTLAGASAKTISSAITVFSTLNINAGSINLGAITSSTANALYLGGAGQPNGTWGGNTSPATNINTTYFAAATGYITVATCNAPGTWTGNSGTDWNTPGNWNGGAVPGAGTDVYISNVTHQPNIGSANGLCNNITLDLGATLTIGSGDNLTISGNWTNNGGTYAVGAGTVIFNGVAQTIAGTGSTTFYNLTTSGTGTVTTGIATTIGGALTVGDGTTFTAAGFALTVTGTTAIGSGTSGILKISAAAGIKTFTGAVTINTGGAITETAAAQLSFGSDVTIGGTLTENGAAVVGIAGSLTNNGTYTASTGLHTFSGSGKTVGGTTTITIPSATFTGNYTNSGTLTCATALTVTGAAIRLTNNGTVTATTALSGTGGLTQGANAILNIGAASAITFLTATASGNTVNYTGAAQLVKAVTYNNLTLSGSGTKTIGVVTVNDTLDMAGTATASAAPTYGASAILKYDETATTGPEWVSPFVATGGVKINSGTVTLGASKVIGNNTSVPLKIVSGATLTPGANLLTFDGDFINAGTLTNGSGGVTIAGTVATQNIAGFTTTGTVNCTKTNGTATLKGNVSAGPLTISGTGGTLDLGNGLTDNCTNLTVSAGTLNGGASTLNVGGSFSVSGNFTAGLSTINFNGTTAQSIGGSAATITFYFLNNSNTFANLTAGTNITVNTLNNISGGTFDMAGYTLTGTTINNANSTIMFSGANNGLAISTGTIDYYGSGQTVTNGTYDNLTINQSSGTATLSGASTTVVSDNLDINTGSLTVPPTLSLSVWGTTTLNSSECLIIQSNTSNEGSFIDNGISGSGTADIQRFVKNSYSGSISRWEYVSSPIASASSTIFSSSLHNLWYADETQNAWDSITNASPQNMAVLKGYCRSYVSTDPQAGTDAGNTTHDFIGTTNSGSYSINATRTESAPYSSHGWNLVGNPYPSAIDWNASSGWTKTNLEDAIYFRTDGTFYSYISGIGTGTATNIIPPMQSFWIRVDTLQTSGILACDNSVRVHSSQNIYRVRSSIYTNTLHVSATNNTNGLADDTYIIFSTDATDGFDNQYDAYKMFAVDPNYPQVYTSISGIGNISINTLSDLVGSRIVPLGFNAEISGQFTFNFGLVSSFTNYGNTVYLKDLQTGTFQNLSSDSIYQFTSGVTSGLSRFLLYFNNTTGIADYTDSQVQIFSNGNDVRINSLNMLNGEVFVYDILGQVVATKHVSGSTSAVISLDAKSAVYIVKYISNEQTISRKINITQ